MNLNPILKVGDNYTTDESILSYETYSFYPETGVQYNNPGNITITVQNSPNWYHPANSWLEIEGDLQKKSDRKPYEADQSIAFANNGILFLFDQMKYLLSSNEIESVHHPGTASNIMGLAKYSTGYKPAGLLQCWAPDTDNDPAVTNKGFVQQQKFVFGSTPVGSFRFAIPLSHIFGFAEDYNKVVYGFVHQLVLTRASSDDNALFRRLDTTPPDDNVPDGKVKITNIRWKLPRVSPSDVAKYELLQQIKAETIFNVGFRMRQCITTSLPDSTQFTWRLGVRTSPEQPRYIFLAFQTARSEDQQKNIATYDHCGVTGAYVSLNNDRYPINGFEINFTKNHYDDLYYQFASFIERFYKVDKMITSTGVNALTYKSLYPIIMFDVSKQSEKLKSAVTDITLDIQFSASPTANSVAHAVMISDRKLRFKANGDHMNVLY